MDVTQFWQHIGSSWNEFQDKHTVEVFWSALASGISRLSDQVFDVQLSRPLRYMPSTINTGPNLFYMVWSGQSSADVNVTLTPTLSGTFEIGIDDWVYSIPTIKYEYLYNGVTYSGVYQEGIHYTISGMSSLVWGNTFPAKDKRFPLTSVLLGYAPNVYRINPILMNTWARFCGFDYKYLSSYNTFGNNQYDHLRMMIWGLTYKQMNAPSIQTLKDAFGIARGLPFAYESGLLSYVYSSGHYNVSAGGYTYVFPSGLTPVASGLISKFSILCSGYSLDDYYSNAAKITSKTNPFSRRNTVVYTLGAASGLSYSSEFFTNYMDKIMPSQIQYFII